MGGVVDGIFGGGEQKQTTEQKLPPWLEEGSKQAVGIAQGIADRPYEAYGGDRYLSPTDNEQAGFLSAAGYRGAYQPYLSQAGGALAGADQRFTDADMSAYMNPYIEGVLDPAAREMGEAFERNRNQNNMTAAQRGAFGGLRNEIGNDLLEESYLESVGDLYSRGLGDAWNQATSLWQGDRAQQQDLAGQYQGLSQAAAAMRGQEVDALLRSGGQQRAIGQAEADFDYGQFLEERNWETSQLQPLLSAISRSPYPQKQTSTSGYDPSTGEKLASGAGALSTLASLAGSIFPSSRDYKTDAQPVEGVLDKLADIPVESWRYKGDEQRHVGPYAEDMESHFGVGNGRGIPAMDAMGVSYAGLKEAARRIKAIEDQLA